MMKIEYTSPNGYRGVLHGSRMSIYDSNGVKVLHTNSSVVYNLDELKVLVEQMPELSKQLEKLLRIRSICSFFSSLDIKP